MWGLPRELIPYRKFSDEMLTKPESLWCQYVTFRGLHSLVAKRKVTVEVEHVWVQAGKEYGSVISISIRQQDPAPVHVWSISFVCFATFQPSQVVQHFVF